MKIRPEEAFERLKPLCVSLTTDYNQGNVQALLRTCADLDPSTLQVVQGYVIFPMRLRLSKELNENVITECIRVFVFVFSRTKISSWAMFTDVMAQAFKFLNGLGPNQYKSEELRLVVCQCAEAMIVNSDEEIHSSMFDFEFCLPLAHYIHILLEIMKTESSKSVRCAALNALSAFLYSHKDLRRNENLLNSAGSRLASFLPGVSIGLQRIFCGDVKQGHVILFLALKLFASFVTLVMGDQYTNDNAGQDSTEMPKGVPSVKRTSLWVKETGVKLEVIVRNISSLVSHEHWKVRMALVECSRDILHFCGRNLQNCISPLLQVLFALSVDSYSEVADASQKAISSFSKHTDHIRSFSSILEEDLFVICSKLIKIHLCADDNQKLSVVKTIFGYLQLLGSSVNKLLYSEPHLDRFLMSMINFLKFDCSDLSYLEENLPPNDFHESHSCSTLWPRKRFRNFQDEEIMSKVKLMCAVLGSHGDVYLLVDYFLGKLDTMYKCESIFLLTNVIFGMSKTHSNTSSKPGSKEYVVSTVIQTFLLSEHWYVCESQTAENGAAVEKSNQNILQVSLMLECIAVCSEVLGKEFQPFLMDVLCPVMEKAGSSNLLTNQCGRLALQVMADSCGYGSVTKLITENADYLISSIILKLQHFLNKPETAVVMRVILEQCESNILVMFKDPIQRLLKALDLNQEKALYIMPILLSVVKTVMKWYPADGTLSSLKPDQKHLGLKESFLEHHRLKTVEMSFENGDDPVNEDAEDNGQCELGNNDEDHDETKPEEMSLHFQLVTEILERCVHMLPSKNLQLSVLSMDIISASILALKHDIDKVLPFVHRIWSPLVHRFSDNLIVNKKAFETLLVIAEECGDFIKSRTMKEVWPKFLSFLSSHLNSSFLRGKSSNYQMANAYKYQILVLSKVGKLAKMIDLTEKEFDSLIYHCMPYLEQGQPPSLQQAAMETIDCLASIDADAVWFHYNELYGRNKEMKPQCTCLKPVHFMVSQPNLVIYEPCV